MQGFFYLSYMKQVRILKYVLSVCFLFTGLDGSAQCSSSFNFYTNSNTPYSMYVNQPYNSATDAIYIWKWNDGSPNDTTYASNANSPSIVHDFPAVGTYTVCVNYQSVSAACNVTSCQNFTVTSMVLPPKWISIVGSSVTETWANSCPILPDTVYNYFTADIRGYTPNQSVIAQILLGDGSDTTMVLKPYYYSSGNGYMYVQNLPHVFTLPGLYSVQFNVRDVTGTPADTVNHYNAIDAQDSCGTLNGLVYLDLNANCLYDMGDSVLTGLWVSIMGPGNNYYGCSNNGGYYNTSVPTANNYTLSVPNLASYGYTYACGGAGISNVNAPGTVNIGVTCPPGFDLTGDFTGWRFRPGDSAFVWGVPQNYSCTGQSGLTTLTLDPNTTFKRVKYGSPVTVNGNQLSWNFSNLVAWNGGWWYSSANFREFVLDCSTNLQIGDSVCFTMDVTPVSGDADPTNNTIIKCFPVQNSWDPNFKEVYPRGVGAQGFVAQNSEFTYTIHFQNTGNAEAYNIAVLDTIDVDLDLSTFQVTGSSHHVQPQYLANGLIKFNFNNIMLPDSASDPEGSQGWVTYKIKAKPGQPGGTQYTNTAYIYFDFNPAIITNTTLNTIELSAVGIAQQDVEAGNLSVAPNPVSDFTQLTLSSKEQGLITIKVIDMLGQVVSLEEKVLNKGKNIFNVETNHLSQGIYLLNTEVKGRITGSIKILK